MMIASKPFFLVIYLGGYKLTYSLFLWCTNIFYSVIHSLTWTEENVYFIIIIIII